MNKVKILNKADASHLIEKLPEDYSMDEIMSELHFKQQVEEGLRDVREGRVYSHEQIKNMVVKWRFTSHTSKYPNDSEVKSSGRI